MSAFIKNYRKYQYKLSKSSLSPIITIFMDWSDDELEDLGNLSIQYSGIESLHEEVEVTRTTYSVEREV